MSKSSINKINKIVKKNFPEIKDKWLSENNQSLILKALKTSKPKNESGQIKQKKYSPYILFCIDKRNDMIKIFPDLSVTEITRKLAEEWGRLKEENPDYISEKYGYVEKEK